MCLSIKPKDSYLPFQHRLFRAFYVNYLLLTQPHHTRSAEFYQINLLGIYLISFFLPFCSFAPTPGHFADRRRDVPALPLRSELQDQHAHRHEHPLWAVLLGSALRPERRQIPIDGRTQQPQGRVRPGQLRERSQRPDQVRWHTKVYLSIPNM